ncbi:MFS transporter [Streptomyces sp. NPDC002004]
MTYRDLATRPVLAWAAVAVGGRLPVAMAPLALVFLVRERPGGYTIGAVLAAAYVIGEIVGAPLLGMRMPADRARPHIAAGLATGALAFAALGALPDAHPAVLAVCAFVAGAGPSATSGGLRALLTSLVPEHATAQAMSFESMLVSGIWSLAPVTTTGLALGAAPRLPLLVAGALMGSAVAGLWLLPAGWDADGKDRDGEPMLRIMAGAWPLFVTGAAGLSLLALAELVLPALLEQRGIAVGWSGPLLAGFSIGSAVGAFVYGLRTWPWRLGTQSLVLLSGVTSCVALAAVVRGTAALAVCLVAAGLLQAGAMLTRNLQLREALPPSALAAGYSLMYAAVGAGYAMTGSLAGGLLSVVAPSTAILAGVGLTVLLMVAGAVGERRMRPSTGRPATGDGGSTGRSSGDAAPTGAAPDDGTTAGRPATGRTPAAPSGPS